MTNTQSNLKVIIVEDDPMVQMGITRLLKNHTNLEILQTVEDGNTGVEKTLSLKPNLVLMDIGLPELNGIEATRRIKVALPDTRILILTCHTNQEEVLAAFSSGANGYCVKGTKIEQLLAAITAVQEGSVYLDASIANYVLRLNKQFFPPSPQKLPDFHFTEREEEVLKLIAEGKSNIEIGQVLNLSPNTVKGYVRQIFAKLSVNDRVKAAKKAWQIGLTTPE